MLGRDIVIDRARCDGCGLCVEACHEGALAIVDGKAELVRKDFCDGLGDCLPACPRNAISFRERRNDAPIPGIVLNGAGPSADGTRVQWPIQLTLAPPVSAFYRGTVVIAADCTAFVCGDFKNRVAGGCPILIGCPKLDDRSRFDKVLDILSGNPVDAVRVVRMEVPCCRALTGIVRAAARDCGRDVAVEETVVSREGTIIGR